MSKKMNKEEILEKLEHAENLLKELDYYNIESAQLGFSIANDLKKIRESLKNN